MTSNRNFNFQGKAKYEKLSYCLVITKGARWEFIKMTKGSGVMTDSLDESQDHLQVQPVLLKSSRPEDTKKSILWRGREGNIGIWGHLATHWLVLAWLKLQITMLNSASNS